MCGLCLPHCPTYRKTGNENESPRGRIALMRALAAGDLPLNDKLIGHLSLCTGCRACESVCPSYVGYAEVFHASLATIAARHRPPWHRRLLRKLLLGLITQPARLRRMAGLLRLYQRSGLRTVLRATGLLRLTRTARLDALLPDTPMQNKKWQEYYPATGEKRGDVALFTGCLSPAVDSATLDATVRVLNRLGYDVRVPANQGCCGAIHLHAGDTATAAGLMQNNLRAFSAAAGAIIGVASGCTAVLAEYSRHLPQQENAGDFSARVTDINRFLQETPWPESVTLAPLARTIAVQDPCSLRNVLHSQQSPYALLKNIPQAQVVPLAENHLCCGGAGAYMLSQPAMADDLRADKLRHMRRLGPDILVSSNLGCALHLAAGLRSTDLHVEVMHPVALIDRQLRD